MLSVSNCRITRQRPAPSEARTAISRRRELYRASSRLATLAHATASSSPTAPSSTSSEVLTLPDHGIAQRLDLDCPVLVECRVRGLQPRGERGHVSLRLADCDAGLHARMHIIQRPWVLR